mmetsp:Transcript_61855/g.178035  ORF Transcript_61855/g.178035 Transcript_61855/m.178035 type:complete len:212 (+) Transcript_61855:354-989(+)
MKARRVVARLAPVKMGAIIGSEPPDAAATAIVHEVRLPQDECHLVLVRRSQVGQVEVGNGCAIRVAGVPIVEAIGKCAPRPDSAEQGRSPPSRAVASVRLRAAQQVDVPNVIDLIHRVQVQGFLDEPRANQGEHSGIVCEGRQGPQRPVRAVVRLVQAVLRVGAEQKQVAVVGLGAQNDRHIVHLAVLEQLLRVAREGHTIDGRAPRSRVR